MHNSMTMLPQPLLDALRSRRCRLVFVLVGVVASVGFGWMIIPRVVLKHHRKLVSEAMQNGQLIGMALYEFQSAYGRYPDMTTSMMVTQRTGNRLSTDSRTSNDYLRQLFAANSSLNETIFRATLIGGNPDGRIDGKHALEKGECGFTYILGATPGQWSRPLLVAPLIPGTDRIDPEPFHGAMIMVRVDGSVQYLKPNKQGGVWLSGKNFFDPENPIWEGKPPVIAWPE